MADVAEPASGVIKETFKEHHSPLLAGIPNGNLIVKVKKVKEGLPTHLMIKGKKVRVIMKIKSNKCYKCNEEGHIMRNCQVNTHAPPLEDAEDATNDNDGLMNEEEDTIENNETHDKAEATPDQEAYNPPKESFPTVEETEEKKKSSKSMKGNAKNPPVKTGLRSNSK